MAAEAAGAKVARSDDGASGANKARRVNNLNDGDGATNAGVDEALRELRVAIEHHVRGRSNIDDLRAAVEQFSATARDDKQPPERLLVALKEALERLPARALDPPSVQSKIKERIVSLAIQTYFDEAP